jgi:DNA-binding HxlR family transcriptional regulator
MPAAKAAAARTPPNHRYRVETGGCPIEASLDVLGGRWKGLLLFYIGRQPQRFHELRKRLPHVSQRMLVRQLRELERDGLLLRKIEACVPPKVEYSATPALTELWPLLSELRNWGARHVMRLEPGDPCQQLPLSQSDAQTPGARKRREPR